ncbi:ATPase domain-containing protein [Caldimonas brevitalea]|uniref:non-specific serine/threonine protein kinase n=1 Tax=Caldimonas brevitalea TaxID=413882 RepID=A0A0G3BHB1_9BURK|nr:ATPase domain-containing protein [Caldimonas brevitalea]AKJ27358.1 circadian clock protein KaiC [Caldimonas brevitalea]
MDAKRERPPDDRAADLLPTGVQGLDTLLGGGLPVGGLYMVEGVGGAGKTVLAAQTGFRLAAQGHQVLFLTLIAESHGKLLRHLASLSFFDARVVGREFVLLNAFNDLESGGPDALLALVGASLNEHRPALLILDGFRTVRGMVERDVDLAKFLHRLSSLSTATGCTTLLLTPAAGVGSEAEHTVVDGVLELSQFHHSFRTTRLLQVYKLRGRPHLLGQHVFAITRQGVEVYPRLEGQRRSEVAAAPANPEPLELGATLLGQITRQGIRRASITHIVGPPGAGKTLMGLEFLAEGLRRGEKCAVLGFYESPERLLARGDRAGMQLSQAVASGGLSVLWHAPIELSLDRLALELFDDITARGVQRVFIDGLDGLLAGAPHPERAQPFMAALTNELRIRGVTTCMTQELAFLDQLGGPVRRLYMSPLYENIVWMRYDAARAQMRRLVSLLKLRESPYDPVIWQFHIAETGFVLDGPADDPPAGPDAAGTPDDTGTPE